MNDRETKTVLVTGGNRGLGHECARQLLADGHRVIITARDRAKGRAALESLSSSSANASARLELFELDLASLASIRAFGAQWEREGRSLDAVVHNAGVMQQSPTRRVTVDGFEETLATNAIGPYLLTKELWPSLVRARAGRVVMVSSRLHLPDSRGEPVRFDFDDPQLERGYSPDRAYKNSKLACLWVTYELARRAEGTSVTANAVCPGFVPVTAAESVKGFSRFMLKYVLRFAPFATALGDAGSSLKWCAVDPSIAESRAKFFAEKREIPSSEESRDPEKARRFCELAAKLCAVDRWPA